MFTQVFKWSVDEFYLVGLVFVLSTLVSTPVVLILRLRGTRGRFKEWMAGLAMWTWAVCLIDILKKALMICVRSSRELFTYLTQDAGIPPIVIILAIPVAMVILGLVGYIRKSTAVGRRSTP